MPNNVHRVALLLVVFIAALQSEAAVAACLKSTTHDAANAGALAKAVEARYSATVSAASKRPHVPAKIGWLHSCPGAIYLRVYNVHTEEDMEQVAASVRESQQAMTGMGQVTVAFYEKESWIAQPGGSRKRGPEKHLKTVVIQVSAGNRPQGQSEPR